MVYHGEMTSSSSVCSAHRLTSLALIVTVCAQIGVAVFVMHATKVMDKEWPRVLQAHGEKVMVVDMKGFLGPVHLLIPTDCREASKWDHRLDESLSEELDVETTTQKPDHTNQGKADGKTTTQKPEHTQQRDSKARNPKGKEAVNDEEETGNKAASKTPKSGDKRRVLKAEEDTDFEEDGNQMEGGGESSNNELRKHSMPAPAEARELLKIPFFIPNVTICKNGTLGKKDFHGPTPWQRYYSMISLSSMTTGGTASMSKLHASRVKTYHSMFLLLMVTMAMKYSLKLIDVCTGCIGHKYVQVWNGGRTTMDKVIESLMIHGVSIVFTLAMQLTLCTVYLTFWQGEYFVMSYIPGIGFVIFFGSFVCFTIGMVVDRIRQTMLNSSACYIYCFWIWWVIWMFAVCVPMLGYSVYVMQFVWQVVKGHWLHKEPFSEEFVHAARIVCHAAGGFTAIAVLELGIILKLDLEEGKVRTNW